MHAHPEKFKSWHEEFVKKMSGQDHAVKVAVNVTDDTVEQCAYDHVKVW